ncbi:MAG: hypothetical protein PHF84_07585 [bacterium]|nr:hypothetical protein [bacterium]
MNRYILILLIILYQCQILSSAYENEYWGVRANGMAGCFTAIANDYSAPMWNPAGLDNLDVLGIQFMYSRPFWGFDRDSIMNNYYASLFYPHPGYGCFSLTYARFAVTELYYEDTYALSYGVNVNEFWNIFGFYWQVGINLKLYNLGFRLDERTENDPVFHDGTSCQAFGTDLGILLSPFFRENQHNWKIGVTLFNLNEPEVGLLHKERIDRKFTVGFAYDLYFPRILRSTVLVPAFKISTTHDDIAVGLEIWTFNRILGLRTGWNKKEISSGLSVNLDWRHDVQLSTDYSFLSPSQVPNTSGTHLFSLSIKFPELTSRLNDSDRNKDLDDEYLKEAISRSMNELETQKTNLAHNGIKTNKSNDTDNNIDLVPAEEGQKEMKNNVMIFHNTDITFTYLVTKKGSVSIQIYNIRGDLIRILVDEKERKPGKYMIYWNGITSKGYLAESGLYFIKFIRNKKEIIKRIMFLK